MYQIKVENCNNIKEGIINIDANKLNIKYGINGTGKTTLAKAIQFANNNDELSKLQSYFSDDLSKVTIIPAFNKILVFNEDFVNQVVFVEDEVIENSFEVFLKTPDYDAKKLQLDSHLQTLKSVLQNDAELNKIDNLTLVRGEKIPDGLYHLVSEIIVRHIDGTYLLMQRDINKHYGGWWEATAGGSALS